MDTKWKNQRIAHWHITLGMLKDLLQLTCVSMLNDNVLIQWLVIIFGLDDNSSDLVSCGVIVTAWITNCRIEHFEMNSQLCIPCNPFRCVSRKLYIQIDLLQDCTQQLKDIEIQIWMGLMTEL